MAHIYKQAAVMLDKITTHQASIKSVTFAPSVENKKKMYALMCEVLKYKPIIDEIVKKTDFYRVERKSLGPNPSIATILLYDFLFGKGIQCGGPYKQSVQRHKNRLKSELTMIKVKRKVTRNEDLLPESCRRLVQIPRYIRVNLIKTTVDDVMKTLVGDGYVEVTDGGVNETEEKGKKKRYVKRDQHLPDVLILPPNTDLHDHPLYTSGQIILQDKASCFPAHVLNPPPNATVLDACAAPGNKTSHVSSLLRNSGTIYAFDLDARRLNTLKTLTSKAGCSNIQPKCGSFLDVKPEEYSDVEYILLDPSCSGSGIVSRLDHLVDQEQSNNEEGSRLSSLSEFQQSTITHALSFPNVRKVVYSTCSVNVEENENVVARILESHPTWRLECALPGWHRRGLGIGTICEATKKNGREDVKESELGQEDAKMVVRTDPNEDETNGFFVACFVKK